MGASERPGRPRWARARRELGRTPDWPTLLLAAFAVTAVVADGAVGTVIAFIAVLLILDRTFAITGYLASDAQHAFARLARQRRGAALTARLRRRPAAEGQLLLLSDELESAGQRRTRGVQAIAIDSIVGTTEPDKAKDFDRCFRPPQWGRGRWQLLWIAHRRGTSLPPISVYRVGDRHYVRDGHFRVSVARSMGASSIDAEVVELHPLPSIEDKRRQ
jgi:hypothetical protein